MTRFQRKSMNLGQNRPKSTKIDQNVRRAGLNGTRLDPGYKAKISKMDPIMGVFTCFRSKLSKIDQNVRRAGLNGTRLDPRSWGYLPDLDPIMGVFLGFRVENPILDDFLTFPPTTPRGAAKTPRDSSTVFGWRAKNGVPPEALLTPPNPQTP
jgi:hypothetical protein